MQFSIFKVTMVPQNRWFMYNSCFIARFTADIENARLSFSSQRIKKHCHIVRLLIQTISRLVADANGIPISSFKEILRALTSLLLFVRSLFDMHFLVYVLKMVYFPLFIEFSLASVIKSEQNIRNEYNFIYFLILTQYFYCTFTYLYCHSVLIFFTIKDTQSTLNRTISRILYILYWKFYFILKFIFYLAILIQLLLNKKLCPKILIVLKNIS